VYYSEQWHQVMLIVMDYFYVPPCQMAENYGTSNALRDGIIAGKKLR